MDERKHEEPEKPEAAEDLEIDDLDLDDPEAENVRGGSGGQYDNAEIAKVLKHV